MQHLLHLTFLAFMLVVAGAAHGTPPAKPGSPSLPSIPPSKPLPTRPGIPRQPSYIQPGQPPRSAVNLVKTHAVADVTHIQPGQKFHLAVTFEMSPDWHIYWKNSGSSGGPTEIIVRAPFGYTIGRTLYPRPSIFESAEGETYGYAGKTAIFVEVTAPDQLTSAAASFTLESTFMVCNKELCLLGNSSDRVMLPASATQVPPSITPDPGKGLKEFKDQVPTPLKDLQQGQAKLEDGILVIQIPARGRTSGQFFPESRPGVIFGEPEIKVENDVLILTVSVSADKVNSLGQPLVVAGVVGLGERNSDPAYEFEMVP